MQGITQMSAVDYHADPCPEPSLSSTTAKILIRETPLDAWCENRRLNPNYVAVDDKDFDLGHAAHSVILGMGGEVVEIPHVLLAANGATSTKAAKDFIADARAKGQIAMKAQEYDRLMMMVEAARAAMKVNNITFDPARSELAAFAHYDGIWNRCQVDNAPINPALPLYDLKTTAGGVSPEELAKTVVNMGYDISAAHYLRTWKEATGEDRRFRFMFVSKPGEGKRINRRPQVGFVELYNDGEGRIASDYQPDEMLSADWFADANHALDGARKQWRKCLDAKTWPGYESRVALVGAPRWHRVEAAVRQLAELILPKGE